MACAWRPAAWILALSLSSGQAFAGATALPPANGDLVGVAILDDGRAILLATPGVPDHGRSWRFRSLDTSDLPQPIRSAVLSPSGTKLFLQPASGPGLVIDLTHQRRPGTPLEYVIPREVAVDGNRGAHSHRLPLQRFVSIRAGLAFVVDDTGAIQAEYPVVDATMAAASNDGAILFVRGDGTLTVCGEDDVDRRRCRTLDRRIEGHVLDLSARAFPPRGTDASTRFLLLVGSGTHVRIVDPEQTDGDGEQQEASRAEASLRACLALNQLSMSTKDVAASVGALTKEASLTQAAANAPVLDWQFFRVAPDEELYLPVLQFARRETVFPGPFETLEELRGADARLGQHPGSDALYERYTRFELEERKRRCTAYFRTHSIQGSWLIEYWLYYPFDVGGLGSHLHDPEHLFVEVDKLGGTVRRVIGAGHGYLAGNNFYSTDKPGAQPVDLPLFAIVELGKHATAPDLNHDGVFVPGLDENEYKERAKIWGVRDVIGTINNQLLAFDNSMSEPRRPPDCIAPRTFASRYPDEPDLAPYAWCRLAPMPRVEPETPACHEATTDCARREVSGHPDFQDPDTVLKEWVFPDSFLHAVYSVGPSYGLHTVGVGYSADLSQMPGLSKFLPLPGRLGGEVFGWFQNTTARRERDPDACIADCEEDTGVGWGVRYEQFLSNLFGIFSTVRVFSPPVGDAWITFGPFVEVPLFNHSNVNLEGGLAFRPIQSPRFELKVTVGVWKPKSRQLGMRARSDGP